MSGHHGTNCSVDDCWVNTKDCLPLFRCPKDPVRCQQWKEMLGFVGNHKYAKITPEQAYRRIHICCRHFEERCFTSSGKRLRKAAIPTKVRKVSRELTDEIINEKAKETKSASSAIIVKEPEKNILYTRLTQPQLNLNFEEVIKSNLVKKEPNTQTINVTQQENMDILALSSSCTSSEDPVENEEQDSSVESAVSYNEQIDPFFKSILAVAKTLNPVNQGLLQIEIRNILFEIRMKRIARNNTTKDMFTDSDSSN